MSSLRYFTPGREEELLWSGTGGAAGGPQPATLGREEELLWSGTGGAAGGPQPSTPGGEEARRFYQSLIDEGGGGERRGEEQRRRERRRRRRRSGEHVQASRQQASTTSTTTELEGLRLLRCAQEGDLSGVRGLLSRGVDVNFQDSWWWTGLMCAAAAGQRGVVRLLLQQGAAWVGVVDTQGRDARELARRARHSGVLEELDGFGSTQDHDHETGDRDQHGRQRGEHNHYSRADQHDHSSPPAAAAVQTHQNQSTQNQTQWCPVCSVHYSCPPETHLSSTLHLFSLSRPLPPPHYCLPPSTPAYQMMLRSGWTPGGGLGPDGEGHKRPVRTVLKRDSRGLGYGPTPRPKVTHFQPQDPQAVSRTGKEGRRGMKEESRREEKDRNWERDFRSSFNTFDP